MELFPITKMLPSGFSYEPDFITVDEEADLVDYIGKIQLHTFKFQGFEAKRRVASFGYDYSFESRAISPGASIPANFDPLAAKVASYLQIEKIAFVELLVTEYPIGSVINWHRDAPPFGVIAGISLLTDCTFRLRPHLPSQQNRKSIISFPVSRRSLYTMQGEVRNNWQHSISPVKSMRYSITLRTLR
jgi:alkylated DNA repair dioxygenase AlkB